MRDGEPGNLPCSVRLWLTGAAALAAGAAVGGCAHTPFEAGKTLAHRYRGVPDSDLSVTPTMQPGRPLPPSTDPQAAAPPPGSMVMPRDRIAAGPDWRSAGPDRRVAGPDRRGPAPSAGANATPAPASGELIWQFAGPDPASAPTTVNVFGEIDGQPRPPAPPTGDAGFQQHSFADEGADSDVVVHPTGKWFAFASTRHSDHTDIYMQRVDGTAVTQLTSDASDDAYPCFSPDGKRIAFASTRGGGWQIYLMDTDGRNVVQVTNGNMQCVHPSFSPDGRRLVYAAIGSRSNQWELWIADLGGNEKRMIGYGLFPSWSPDRSVDRIAYQRARQRGGRWFSLWMLDLIEGEGRRLTEIAASANAAIVAPTWSPDGKRLSFATILDPAAAPAAAGAADQPGPPARPRPRQDIWSINADGANRQRLTDGSGTNLSPFWASDNRVYFISDRGGNEAVWSVRADSPGKPTLAAAPPAVPAPPDEPHPEMREMREMPAAPEMQAPPPDAPAAHAAADPFATAE